MNILLCSINEGIHVGFVSFHVFILDKPFNRFFNQFFRWQKHIFQQLNQLSLQLRQCNTFTHFKYFNYSFLFFYIINYLNYFKKRIIFFFSLFSNLCKRFKFESFETFLFQKGGHFEEKKQKRITILNAYYFGSFCSQKYYFLIFFFAIFLGRKLQSPNQIELASVL